MVTDFREYISTEVWLYVGACVIIMVYEFILGVVRVQDYFAAYYERLHFKDYIKIRLINRTSSKYGQIYIGHFSFRLYGKSDNSPNASKSSIAAVMEGKLKEKLESTGIACLCLAQANVCSANSIC